MIGYYRKFIRNFAVIAKPPYDLAKKMFLSSGHKLVNNTFNELNDKMLSADVTGFPNFKRPFILATDTSATRLRACLSQEINGGLKPVGFAG